MQVKRLLLPVKGERVEEQAIQLACELTRAVRGRIYALYVIEIPRRYPVDAELPLETSRAEEVLRRVERQVAALKGEVTASLVQARDVGPAVVKEAMERDVDLILMAKPYKRRHGAFALGSAIPYILQNAPCPVLVLREAMPQETPTSSAPPWVGARTGEGP